MTITEAPAGLVITEPGVYDGMPPEIYHSDPVPGGSLSSTGARKLLPPGCPAKFAYERENPPESTDAFDFGKAAHRAVLSAGEDIAVLDYPDYKTAAARKARDDARAKGLVPVLDKHMGQVEDMAAAIREHPDASLLLDPALGRAEVSLFARTEVALELDGGGTTVPVWLRARLDHMPHLGDGSGRYVFADYKTCASADPEKLQRAFADYWYPQQADFYETVLRLLGLVSDPRMVFVCQEKTPPYLVTVVDPDAIARRAAAQRNREALDIYARCVVTGRWPGYADGIVPLPLPAYVENQYV